MIAYGPVMLNEALGASEALEAEGFGLQVVSLPWLNRFDESWLRETVSAYRDVFVLEDHSPVGGLGDRLLQTMHRTGLLENRRLHTFGVEGFAACGTPIQALGHHRLDAASLATRVREARG